MRLTTSVFAALCSLTASAADFGLMQRYFNSFAAADEELYTNTVDNAHAYEFLKGNVPFFGCPDEDITRTYYFRWWTYRKHLRKTAAGWVVTEFLPPVGWAGAENTISGIICVKDVGCVPAK